MTTAAATCLVVIAIFTAFLVGMLFGCSLSDAYEQRRLRREEPPPDEPESVPQLADYRPRHRGHCA